MGCSPPSLSQKKHTHTHTHIQNHLSLGHAILNRDVAILEFSGFFSNCPRVTATHTHLDIIITWSFSLLQLYLNGTNVTGEVVSEYRSLTSTDYDEFCIGMHNTPGNTAMVANSFLSGAVDEILFWPTVKDQNFVTSLYLAYNGKPSNII